MQVLAVGRMGVVTSSAFCWVLQVLSKEVYQTWLEEHKQAESGMDDRDTALRDSACRIEQDLELLGTAEGLLPGSLGVICGFTVFTETETHA